MRECDVIALSPLNLAFIGDAVYGLYVKERFVTTHDYKTNELTKQTNYYLKAVTQAKILEMLLPELTQKEQDVARRCRNAHVNNKAKNASLTSYKKATALEGVFGYLYLVGEKERLVYLLDKNQEYKEDKENKDK